VTPFDQAALLAILNAFYPVVSAASLARARNERPEYFAGGTLFGSKGDKLRLPDGREFDLIFAAGGFAGQQRWQVIDAAPGDAGDGLVDEPGALVPIDVEALPTFPAAAPFESLALAAVAELNDQADTVDHQAHVVNERGATNAPDDTGTRTLDDAREGFENAKRGLVDVDPIEGITHANGMPLTIQDQQSQFPTEYDAPERMPTFTVPKPRRPDDEPGGGPGELGGTS
jgi:hypothetical protein